MSKIARCTCTQAFQDKRYGPGMRVHNETKKGDLVCTSRGKGAPARQADWKKYKHRKVA